MAAVSVLIAACGSDGSGGDVDAVPTTTSIEVAEVSTTVADPTTTTTSIFVGAVFAGPDDAAVALFEAWTTGDEAAAVRAGLGPPDQLAALFATPVDVDVRRRTCSTGEFGVASCFFGNGQGGVNIELEPAGDGWTIVRIDPFT